MDTVGTIVIHVNNLYNQKLYGRHLCEGFERLGCQVVVTDQKEAKGDVHVCIGPHFAFKECLGKNTIYVDRCLWGDDLEAVTIGWLDNNGGMRYPTNCSSDRPKPEYKPWIECEDDRAILLLDWGPYPLNVCNEAKLNYEQVTFRPHPATNKTQPPLLEHLKGHKVVIGMRTSAMVTAILEGYPIISFDSRSPVASVSGRGILDIQTPDRDQWLNNMSYAQWSADEIRSGEALEYVLNCNNLSSRRAYHA